MKKLIIVGLMALVTGLFVACNNPAPAPVASPVPASSDDPAVINTLLDQYDAIVTSYLADQEKKDAAAVAEDETKLGEISPKLADAGTKFTPEQQKRYDDITARLSN